jgi:hypothetical protein
MKAFLASLLITVGLYGLVGIETTSYIVVVLFGLAVAVDYVTDTVS